MTMAIFNRKPIRRRRYKARAGRVKGKANGRTTKRSLRARLRDLSRLFPDEPESYGSMRRTKNCWWANGSYYSEGHVTHWQPLPSPPEGSDKGEGPR